MTNQMTTRQQLTATENRIQYLDQGLTAWADELDQTELSAIQDEIDALEVELDRLIALYEAGQ